MIKNFEDYTHELTPDELHFLIPYLIRQLTLCIGKDRAKTNRELTNEFNYVIAERNYEDKRIKTSGPRVRHAIHVLRVSGTIPRLLASSKGYYISNDEQEIEDYIQSVDDRLRSIYQIRRALRNQLKDSKATKDTVQQEINFTE